MYHFIESLGFKVSLWTHPFISPQCEAHEFAKTKDFFVKNTTGSIETVWWNGDAALVDFTNPSAREWWSGRLQKLLAESGIDTLKFDAGESSWYVEVICLTTNNTLVLMLSTVSLLF